ncbi:hypothetical protein BT93_K1616 [Corymbia citriodora subsp. variegata]|nr:hypothetical protein BT93_K1616 [Corymbia citriodora subsp. variegata]
MGSRARNCFARFFRPLLGNHSLDEVRQATVSLGKIAAPVAATTLLIFSRSIVSMLFLSRLGKTDLAGCSLALAFANITGYSVLKGLAMGMEPICSQAFGAKKPSILIQTYQKTLLCLLFICIPISLLWLNMEPLFLRLGQDEGIVKVATACMVCFVPELFAQALLQPLRTFLRTQGLMTPVTSACLFAAVLHLPINYLLVVHMDLRAKGVALALAWNSINTNLGLLAYMVISKKTLKPWQGRGIFLQNFREWRLRPLLTLAVPSCAAVCLEWWWYDILLFLCSFLKNNSRASISAMGIVIQIAGLFYTLPFALSSSLSTCIGHALGGGHPCRARVLSTVGVTASVALSFLTFIFLITMRSTLGRMYTSELEILNLESAVLPILGLCELAGSPQTAVYGVLAGTARPDLGARIKLFSFYFIGMPVAILLAFKWEFGFRGLWFGLLASQISCVSMMAYTLMNTDWKQQAKRAIKLTEAAGDKDD